MKHKDLIQAALNGETIQYRLDGGPAAWAKFSSMREAVAHMACEYIAYESCEGIAYEYRIAPKDRVVYRYLAHQSEVRHGTWRDYDVEQKSIKKPSEQFKITYDGETGKIKSVEVVQ